MEGSAKIKGHKTDKKSWIGLVVALIMFGAVSIATTSMAGEASFSGTAAIVKEESESDPWEPFSSKMVFFNHDILDRYVLKLVAKGWNFMLPDVVQHSLRNVVDNTNVFPRLLDSLIQGSSRAPGGRPPVLPSTVRLASVGFWISLKMALALTRAMKIPAKL